MRVFRKMLGFVYGKMRAAYYEERYSYFKKKYEIQTNFKFNGVDIRIYGNGKIHIGNDSYIGNYSTIQLKEGCKVVIGDRCQISHNVRMYTSSADPDQDFTKEKIKPPKSGDIIIGNGVWVGANVFINPGVNIGDNAVIGANTVVTKDIPPNAVAGGVPARVIRLKDYNKGK